MRIRLIRAIYPEGPWFTLLRKRPFFGIEVRVGREHFLWIGYTTKAERERGW